jgi:tetratricopeptide (TPR) repeat protein
MDFVKPEYALLWADVTEFALAMEAQEKDMGHRTVDGWLPELNGFLLQQAGDAVLLAFPDARHALQAGWRLQRDWAELAPRTGRGRFHELRIALHWGSLIKGAYGYVAHSLNQLARLSQQVHAGQIWCSDEFKARLPQQEQRRCEDLGWLHFKHLDQGLRAYRAPWTHITTVRSRPATDLPQLRLLIHCAPRSDAMEWVQAWIAAIRPMRSMVVVEWVGQTPGHDSDFAIAMRQARAEFLLVRRGTVDRAHEVRLVASPWALQLMSWDGSEWDLTDANLARMPAELQRAMGDHVLSTGQSQPESALSHGMLKEAALLLMHAGNLKGFERSALLLQAWGQRYKRQAQPHVWNALWHVMRHTRGLGRVDTELALAHINRALQLEPEHAHAQAALGFALGHLKGDIEGAMRCLEKAQALDPDMHWVGLYRSVFWCILDEPARANREADQALSLAPQDTLHPYALGLAGHAALYDRQLQPAIDRLEASWRHHRHHSPTLRALVIAHQMQGHHPLARFFLRELLSLEPRLTARNYLGRNRAGHARRAEMAHWLMEAGLPMK